MPQQFKLRIQHLAALLGLVATVSISGCHHQAHTDLYVDSMASEIRDLEDQLYQYDHEYRLLEQELETLRRQSESIQQSAVQAAPAAEPSDSNSPFDFLKRGSTNTPELVPPSIQPNTVPNGSNSTEKPRLPSPSIMTPPNSDNLPAPATDPTEDGSRDLDFNAGELIVPTISDSAMTPPSLTSDDSLPPERNLELTLSQIELPSQLASTPNNTARITSAVQAVTDKRVVEVAFHPALTRAISFDDDNTDDGLYLVLQPKNELGQVVPIPALVTISVLDPTRADSQAIIGTRQFSAKEIESKIQPIGNQQGIHLTLPWNGPNPKSDVVTVVATMQFENGRKVIGRKEIFLSNGNGLKTVWTSRAASGARPGSGSGFNQDTAGPVITASATASPNTSERAAVQSVGNYPEPESAPQPQLQFQPR